MRLADGRLSNVAKFFPMRSTRNRHQSTPQLAEYAARSARSLTFPANNEQRPRSSTDPHTRLATLRPHQRRENQLPNESEDSAK